MLKPITSTLLALVLGCVLPYVAPYSLAPALHSFHRVVASPGVGRGQRLKAASTVRRISVWATHKGTARRQGLTELCMVSNTDLLQSIDSVELEKMKVAELKELCDAFGLSKTGKKADLVARISELQKATMAQNLPSSKSAVSAVEDAGLDDLMDDDADLQGAQDIESITEYQEPMEVYNVHNPAPARMFNANGQALIQEKLPDLRTGELRLVAQPRTGNCWHGIFFDIRAKDKPITVTSIRTASSPEGSAPIREDKMNMWVYTCEGSAVGKELQQDAWTLVGTELGIQLPVVSYGESEPFYGALPIEGPIKIKAGGAVGVCIFTSSWRGVVLRAKLGEASGWKAGDLTDESNELSLHAGILPKNDEMYIDTMFTKVYKPIMANAFVGAIEYTVG